MSWGQGAADFLRTRLGELARARRAEGEPSASSGETPAAEADRVVTNDAHAVPPAMFRERAADAVSVESFLPGGEWRGERGTVYVHERLRSDVERRHAHWGTLGEPSSDLPELEALAAIGLGGAMFLDLETGGLSSSPVFLAGTMHWNGEDFVLRQYFARHYGEEAALIEALDLALSGFEAIVTFNGKSYDAPFLRGRALLHGVGMRLPAFHLDLLHLARRRWKTELADCRLQTLERYVCRRRRYGDVPGEEVPGLYHDFVRRGDPYRLVPVFHHNLLDVITMAEILRALGNPAIRLQNRPFEPFLYR
ncbi:MAG TPA: ribonuclease H-like domain-containing protein [Candidatus Udaeobacter sp.]|jgi:uncharacterized protein YprB with RNaseH-like and TPR domain|nr:ribonuclease H-like domain-containing protein [Candidatus Udaeobacter sp.]